MDNITRIKSIFDASIRVKQALLAQDDVLKGIEQAVDTIEECFQQDKKLLLCGNGGSAADAQHLAAEFSGRFYYDRAPLFAEALHVNTSYLTAVGNDYSYEAIYGRLVEAKGRKGDVLIAISTSGNSPNIIKAVEVAKAQQLSIIGFTGATGGILKDYCDILLNVPSTDTPRIQEAHILIGHIICELVEDRMFKKS